MANIKDLAKAIYDDLAPWERDDSKMSEIIETLEHDPLEVVKYLVERFITEV
jgi:hypothetical protein